MQADPDLIIEYEHPDGHLEIHLSQENVIVLKLDHEEFSRHPVSETFDRETIQQVLEFEAGFWDEQQRPLEEVAYNLEQLEFKLQQWPYIRDQY